MNEKELPSVWTHYWNTKSNGQRKTPFKALARYAEEERTFFNFMLGQYEVFVHTKGAIARCQLDPWQQRAADRLTEKGVLVKSRSKKNRTAHYRLSSDYEPKKEQ